MHPNAANGSSSISSVGSWMMERRGGALLHAARELPGKLAPKSPGPTACSSSARGLRALAIGAALERLDDLSGSITLSNVVRHGSSVAFWNAMPARGPAVHAPTIERTSPLVGGSRPVTSSSMSTPAALVPPPRRIHLRYRHAGVGQRQNLA